MEIDFSTAGAVSQQFYDVLREAPSSKYTVTLEMAFTARRGTKTIKHEIFIWLVRDTTDLTRAQIIHAAFAHAKREDIFLFALYNDDITITEVFDVEREDPEEGDTNWFKRHGLPDDVVIQSIGAPVVDIKQHY